MLPYFIFAVLVYVGLFFLGVFDPRRPRLTELKVGKPDLPSLPPMPTLSLAKCELKPSETGTAPLLPKPVKVVSSGALPAKVTSSELPAQPTIDSYHVTALEERDSSLVDIPADWLPGGVNHVANISDYVDFSEMDRYSVEAVHTTDAIDHLDAEMCYWRAPEVEDHQFDPA